MLKRTIELLENLENTSNFYESFLKNTKVLGRILEILLECGELPRDLDCTAYYINLVLKSQITINISNNTH